MTSFLRSSLVLAFASLILGSPLSAQTDSAPTLVSRTGGGSGWSNLEELQKAAASGNPKACASLGEMFLNGDRVAKDIPHGIALLEQAAQKGEPDAAFRLGKIYDDGDPVSQDYHKALDYYRTSALAGNATAQYNLGVLYAGAHGVKRDLSEGLAWLMVATKNGASGDGEKQVRDQLTKTKHPEMIAAAEKRAEEIATQIHPPESPPPTVENPSPKTNPAASGKDRSSHKPNGKPKAQNSSSSRTVSAPAAPAPAAPTSFNLPDEVHSAEQKEDSGAPIRLATPSGTMARWPSLSALERDAEKSIPAALSALGQILIEGKLAPADPQRAVGLLEQGAKAESPDAAYQLGEIYTRGVLAPKNDEKAFSYTLQAAKSGIAFAMFNVGGFYANGRGTPKDYGVALTWLVLAKKNGLDRGIEDRIRAYLAKNDPDKIPAAEARAAEFEREIAVSTK